MATLRSSPLLYLLPLLLTSALTMAQQGDGGAASGNIPATANGGSVAGAAGSSTATVTISTGAIVAIVIVVVIVCVLGVSTAVLFFFAKKRQWTIRETLRRSRRRVTTGLKNVVSPLSPSRATFSPGPFKTKFSNSETKGLRGGRKAGEKYSGIGLVDVDMEALNGKHNRRNNNNDVKDLEKGEESKIVVNEAGRKNGHRPQKPSVTIPTTGRKVEEPKTPLYSKFFGRD